MTTTLGLRDQLPYLPRALGLVWHAAPGWTAVWSVLLLVQGVLPVAVVYTTRAAVDRLAEAVGASPTPEAIRSVIIPALILAALFLLSEVLRAGTRFVRSAQAELVRDHISALVHTGTIEADLAQFESPAFHDRLFRARMDSHERPIALIQGLGSLVQNSITLAAMAVVLIPYGWWVPLALVVSTAPALVVVARYAVIHHRWTVDATSRSRRTWYYDWLLSTRETASEIRLFAIGPRFSEAFQSIRRQLRRERLAFTRAEAVSEIAAGGFALLVSGGLAVWMIVRTVDGTNSLGDLALFLQAFTQGQRLMRSLLETVGTVWSNILFLDNLFGFLDVEPGITDPAQPQAPPAERPPGLAFRSVSFTYPGNPKPVFEGLDLEVAPGSTAALIGVNGAGKSTLIKLLCRFYDPDLGTVEIGGTDLKTVEISELRRLVSALFQEPVHYSETAAGNLSVAGRDHEAEPERLREAIRFAGAEQLIEKLPEGLHTLLGTLFSGGAELSVGEWQRLALARALVRDAPVLLLDEPTSAMDSWSEARWSEGLSSMARRRTVLIVTHRLTTAMHADRIHVMDDGRIVESGTHEELLEAKGAYWTAWDAQFGE